VKTLGQVEEQVRSRKIPLPQVLQVMMVLTGNTVVQAVQDEAQAKKAKATADRLNANLLDRARGAGDISYLASPMTGGGFGVSRFGQLFLLARSQGRKQAQEWAEFAWRTISTQGHRLMKDGKPMEKAEDNVAELSRQATEFAEKRLPVLKALGIA